MVIGVFSGEKPSGGFSIEIAEIMLMETKITVFFDEISPKPEQPVTEALTQPSHIVKIKRVDNLPLTFIRG